MFWKFVLVDWYISGNVMIMEVIIVVYYVKIMGCWKIYLIVWLSRLCFLNMIINKNLIMDGGSINGSINVVLIIIFFLKCFLDNSFFIIVFKIIMINFVINVILSDSWRGDKNFWIIVVLICSEIVFF